MRHRSLTVFALALCACSNADPSFFEALRDSGRDSSEGVDGGGDAAVDTGPDGPQLVDRCGDRSAFVITETSVFDVDTRGLGAETDVSCAPSAGNDGFFAIDVQAGEYWHFHLHDASGDEVDRKPVLYLLDSGCDPRRCIQLSNQCGDSGDEHFAFLPDTGGIWYLGIDDENAGGGLYTLQAIRPDCGNGVSEHGESCDGQPGCDSKCRWVLDSGRTQEQIPNDNVTEANVISLPPAGGELEITGDIGGSAACNYPDMFAVVIADGGAALHVDIRADGASCPAAAAAPYSLALLNSAGGTRAGATIDTNGCPIIDATLPAGLYYVSVGDTRVDPERPNPYHLKFAVTP